MPEGEALIPINFRATAAEKLAFKRTAKQEKKSLSVWIRTTLTSKSNSARK
jgi:hypothetical protein